MFKKIFVKSAATTAAVGSALALSLVANPAVVATAPAISNVACAPGAYPSSVSTTTTVSLNRAMGQYGMYKTAVASVDAGDEIATGSVRFVLYNSSTGAVLHRDNVDLDATAQADVALPRYLRANQSYMLTASYIPGESCYQGSDATAAFHTVFKRKTATDVNAPNRTVRQRPTVTVSVAPTATGGLYVADNAPGRAKVVVKKKGRVVRSTTVRLSGGSMRVSFSRLRTGYYTAQVRYLGNVNFAASSGADSFRVRR